MAIDKDKVAKEALRFIQKGQFPKAIAEYKRVLASDPRDIRTRLKLVDLYGRVGSTKEAIDECLLVAESYSDQGFYLKAIAVYKQALRIDAQNSLLYRSIGELYVKQGLVGDALAAFMKAVELLRQAGLAQEAEAVLGRMAEMAPDNVAIKIHLAELYLTDGRAEAFEQALEQIVSQLRGEGRTRKLLQALEGFYEKSPRVPGLVRRLAEAYADLNEDAKALDLVGPALEANPADRELRLLALRTQLALGQLAEARRIALSLYEEDPGDLFILEQLCAIAEARGDARELAEAHRLLARTHARKGGSAKEEYHFRKVLELLPDDEEAREAVGGSAGRGGGAGAQAGHDETETLELQGFWDEGAQPAGAGASPVSDGLTEVDLYLKYGMEEKAAQKLAELCDEAPDDVELHKKLRDLCQRRGDRNGWIREQLRIASLYQGALREGEALRCYQAVLDVEPGSPEARDAIARLKPEAAPAGARSAGVLEGGALAAIDFGGDLGTSAWDAPLGTPSAPAGPGGDADFIDLQADVLDASTAAFGSGPVEIQDFDITNLEDIVREFKSSIAEKLEEGDYETHYNLGVAYKEMGLIDDALREFQVAARSNERSREAYTSMAMIFREGGKPGDARAALRMALAAPTNTEEDRAAILYELGVVSTEDGDPAAALQSFEKAAALVPSFRDVDRRIQTLRSQGAG